MDSATTLSQVINRCIKCGIGCVAVADHGTTEGGRELQKIAPFQVIVAEEILANEGEVIGLFLSHDIAGGSPAIEIIARIREQGGLVYLPHPCDTMRGSIMRDDSMLPLLAEVDIVEVFNSRALPLDANRKASKLAERYGLLRGAGSDAHTAGEIGNAWIEMEDFADKDSFMKSLGNGRIVGKRASPMSRLPGLTGRISGLFR
jgi:predicted metal-dependent phosphoesterase TrpH